MYMTLIDVLDCRCHTSLGQKMHIYALTPLHVQILSSLTLLQFFPIKEELHLFPTGPDLLYVLVHHLLHLVCRENCDEHGLTSSIFRLQSELNSTLRGFSFQSNPDPSLGFGI